MNTSLDTMNTLSSACDSIVDLLEPGRLPTNFEDVEEDEYLKTLELEMEIESSLYADEDQFPESPMEIRSLVQLPGNSQNSMVWVHTKTGRKAKIILEAQDESENVGLLEYEDQTQEIRRLSSYANKKNSTTNMTPKVRRVDSLAIPNMGGDRIPSMRTGKNPFFDPRQSELIQSPCAVPNLPSMRAGKNPHFSPSAAVFF
jgi:hypothetical protein